MRVPADFDGDGASDLEIYRRSTGTWLVLTSSTGFTAANFFRVPDAVYHALQNTGLAWKVNEKMLTLALEEGWIIRLSQRFTAAWQKTNKVLWREIPWLLDHGYKWADDFQRLLPPGAGH